MDVVAIVLAGIAVVWQIGDFVSRKTKNTVDDAVFQHPEVEAAVRAAVEAVLRRKQG